MTPSRPVVDGGLRDLRTYTDLRIALGLEDVAYLDGELRKYVKIRRPAQGDGYVLNPGKYIFVFQLPSGQVLRSRPRHPVKNVFRMLAHAYGLDVFLDPNLAGLTEMDDLVELVTQQFVASVEARLAAGLFREYVDVAENLIALRGRISFVEDMRQNAVLRQRTYCAYSDLRWDVPENQVLKFVTRLLLGTAPGGDLEDRLTAIDRTMDEVSVVPFLSADVARFTYHRHTVDYRPIHDLCRLVIDSYGVFEDEGTFLFPGFALSMEDLFERFLRGLLDSRLAGSYEVLKETGGTTTSLGIRYFPRGTPEECISLEPDLVFQRGLSVQAVGDCKFKLAPSSGDFYQVLAYCIGKNTEKGLLLFARGESSREEGTVVDGYDDTLLPTGVVVRRIAVDLMAGTDVFELELARVTRLVEEWLDGGSLVPSRTQDVGLVSTDARRAS